MRRLAPNAGGGSSFLRSNKERLSRPRSTEICWRSGSRIGGGASGSSGIRCLSDNGCGALWGESTWRYQGTAETCVSSNDSSKSSSSSWASSSTRTACLLPSISSFHTSLSDAILEDCRVWFEIGQLRNLEAIAGARIGAPAKEAKLLKSVNRQLAHPVARKARLTTILCCTNLISASSRRWARENLYGERSEPWTTRRCFLPVTLFFFIYNSVTVDPWYCQPSAWYPCTWSKSSNKVLMVSSFEWFQTASRVKHVTSPFSSKLSYCLQAFLFLVSDHICLSLFLFRIKLLHRGIQNSCMPPGVRIFSSKIRKLMQCIDVSLPPRPHVTLI